MKYSNEQLKNLEEVGNLSFELQCLQKASKDTVYRILFSRSGEMCVNESFKEIINSHIQAAIEKQIRILEEQIANLVDIKVEE